MAEQLTLKRASASRPSGEWNADNFGARGNSGLTVDVDAGLWPS
jgi:hypothetical protein